MFEVAVTGIFDNYVAQALADTIHASNLPESMSIEVREIVDEIGDDTSPELKVVRYIPVEDNA